MLILNDPIRISHHQKLAKKLISNDALVIEIESNYFSERKKNFGRLRKR